MKPFFLSGLIVCTVLILILAFENIASTCTQFLFLFFPVRSTFMAVTGVALVGVITGVFLAAFFSQMVKDSGKDEESTGADFNE